MKHVYNDNAKHLFAIKEALERIKTVLTTALVQTSVFHGQFKSLKRLIIENMRAILEGPGMERKFWREAIRHADYLYNRTVSRCSSMK